jgi:hypothetical protein
MVRASAKGLFSGSFRDVPQIQENAEGSPPKQILVASSIRPNSLSFYHFIPRGIPFEVYTELLIILLSNQNVIKTPLIISQTEEIS